MSKANGPKAKPKASGLKESVSERSYSAAVPLHHKITFTSNSPKITSIIKPYKSIMKSVVGIKLAFYT